MLCPTMLQDVALKSCEPLVCLSECDKIAKWQFFMSRYIFLNQVFYIHGKFLYIHVKTIYSLSMRLASYQMFFFFSCQFTCTIFIHQEGLVTSSGLTTGESGNRPQEKQHGGRQFTFITRRPFWSPWGIKALSLHCLCPSSLTLNERFDGQNLLFGH